jgi:hypothetical protein
MKKDSPLKAKPLRQAGQSIQEKLDKLLGEKLEPYLLIPAFLIVLAFYEWIRWWQKAPPYPILTTIAALGALAYCVPKVLKIRRRARLLKQGRDGEKVVGEYLERLRETGCVIFHDVLADTFNVDHVVLSEKGIFVIETKTFSKTRGARVHSNGTQLTVDGLGDQTSIIDQALGNSRWVREMLRESTGRTYPTKPVVVFPGWYVEGGLHKDLWVINPRALPKLLEGENKKITHEDVKLAAFHLSRFIRASG